jgi:hypothetical protein
MNFDAHVRKSAHIRRCADCYYLLAPDDTERATP